MALEKIEDIKQALGMQCTTRPAEPRELPQFTQTAWFGRLKHVFRDITLDRQEYPETELSPELHEWGITTFSGAVCAGLVGGLSGARSAGEEYIKENKSTVYKGQRHAQSELNMAAGKAFAQIGGRWALYGFGLTAVFTGLHIGASVVREKRDVFNVVGAGTVTGALFWIPYGLSGIAAGAFHGSVLGLVGGIAMQMGWILQDKVDPLEDRLARQLEREDEIAQIREERRLRDINMQKVTSQLIMDLEAQLKE
eukprot:CFRG0346T1